MVESCEEREAGCKTQVFGVWLLPCTFWPLGTLSPHPSPWTNLCLHFFTISISNLGPGMRRASLALLP